MSLKILATSIASRNCALFAGSGLTCDDGGARWNDLVKYLIEKFRYSSPLTDNFDIIEDIIRINGPENVYNTVKERLQNASIPINVIGLMKLPWFATFTTNYDLALEKALSENQSLFVRVIVTGNEFQLEGQLSELLCVKLMGSLDIQYKNPGAMVLDKGDFALAQDERSRILDTLSAHAANKSFLFYGYSFNDDLFFNILSKLSKYIGEPKNTFYAFFLEEPNEEMRYKLTQNNIEIIVDTPENFVKSLTYEVSLRNPGDLSKKKLQIGQNIIIIDTTKIGSFLSLYHPVLFDQLEENIEAKSFFYGNTSSLKPFFKGWHYPRREIYDLFNSIVVKESEKSSIFAVLGYPGTGRTFTILATVNRLIREANSLAIRIPDFAIKKIPDIDELTTYIETIIKIAETDKCQPERLVFFSDSELDINDVLKFEQLSKNIAFPLFLIYEGQQTDKDYLTTFFQNKVKFLDVSQKLDGNEKKEIGKFLINAVQIHRLPEIAKEDVDRIVDQEKEFLPIIYRLLDPARRSIDQIIEMDYHALSKTNQLAKHCISYCALSSFFHLPIPISVLKKALEQNNRKVISYNTVYEIINISNRFNKEERDRRINVYFSTYHRILALRIMKLNGIEENDTYLINIANSIDLQISIESDFFGKLFIERGVNLPTEYSKPYSKNALIKSFEKMKNRQPARPVLHHLARLYELEKPGNERVIPLLDNALSQPSEKYYLNERKENILTTKAKILWDRDRERLSSLSKNHPDVNFILSLLIEAEQSRISNPHPYDFHVRILRDLSKQKDESERIALINEAVDLINSGIERMVDGSIDDMRLNELLIECLSEISFESAKIAADDLFNTQNNGSGYYTLARVEYHKNKQIDNALVYLSKAIQAKIYPLNAIALKIEILIQQQNPPYNELFDLVEKIPDTIFQDTWKTAYYKAIIYTINGYFKAAERYFDKTYHIAPRTSFSLPRYIFWMEGGHRKVFNGLIHPNLHKREGRIYSHNVPNWELDIFFRPIEQKEWHRLKTGMRVQFELGFNTRGPIGFEIRPYKQ